MGRVGKILCGIFGVGVVVLIAFIVFSLYSGHVQTKYLTYLRLATDAASASSGISVDTGNEAWQLLESDSGRKLYYYLSQNPMVALGSGDSESTDCIRLKIGEDLLTVTPVKNKPNSAVVTFSVLDQTFRMTIRSDGLWGNLRDWTGQSHYAKPAVTP